MRNRELFRLGSIIKAEKFIGSLFLSFATMINFRFLIPLLHFTNEKKKIKENSKIKTRQEHTVALSIVWTPCLILVAVNVGDIEITTIVAES